MTKIIVISIVYILSYYIIAQDSLKDYREFIEYVELVDSNNIEVHNLLLTQNLSNIWVGENRRTFGFIGSKYRRLRIKFISVIKDEQSANTYFVYGKSKVSKNIRDFQGKLLIEQVYKIKEPIELQDLESGLILGSYVFYENSNLESTGKFEGRFVSYWYQVEKGIAKYNDLWDVAAGYNNNQFVGTWQSYSTSTKLTAYWGDGRIPLSEGFDVGTSEFAPNLEYIQNGWESYIKAWGGGFSKEEIEEARREENEFWWK